MCILELTQETIDKIGDETFQQIREVVGNTFTKANDYPAPRILIHFEKHSDPLPVDHPVTEFVMAAVVAAPFLVEELKRQDTIINELKYKVNSLSEQLASTHYRLKVSNQKLLDERSTKKTFCPSIPDEPDELKAIKQHGYDSGDSE